MSERNDEVLRGTAIYTRLLLNFYDPLVVYLSNSFAWRCHRNRMVDRYERDIGARHLDIGPGTGWYLAKAHLPPDAVITLMDLNDNSLASASTRLADRTTSTVVANVLDPLPHDIGPFDSIGANYLFHCVPGTWAEKGAAFGNLARALAPGGVFFGGTILGQGVRHNAAGRKLMALYNDKGIFHNTRDDAEGLERALRLHFDEVSVDVVGTVALFRATVPKTA